MRPLTLHRGAEIDLRDALEYYENQRTGLGGEFRREFDAAIERIRICPELGGLENQFDIRFRTIRRFPLRVVYTEMDDRIWVIAVAHGRRHPNYWSGRKAGD